MDNQEIEKIKDYIHPKTWSETITSGHMANFQGDVGNG